MMDYSGLIPTEDWLKSFAQFFESPIIENRVNINPLIGKGYIESQKLEKGFDLVVTDISFTKDIYIRRNSSENNGIIIKYLIHTPSSYLVVSDGEDKHVIKDGIYVSTPHSLDTNYVKSGCQFQALSFHLSFEWIKEHHNETSLILNHQTITYPFFFFEKITPALKQLAMNLFSISGISSPYRGILLKSLSNELLAKTLSLFDYRKKVPVKEFIKNRQDIKLLLEIREKLTNNFEKGCPTIQSISDEYRVSPTKLKLLFKSFYGKSVFQYFQQERMELAKKMIENGYSIADVGYKIGYTNLSKFSSAYRKQFGYNPKETMLD